MDLARMPLESLRAELLREPGQDSSCQPSSCRDACASPYAGPQWPPLPLVDYRLAVAREILLRAAYDDLIGPDCLGSPTAARDYFSLHFATLAYEVFLIAYLDAQNHVILIEEASRGTLTATSVYPREILKAGPSVQRGWGLGMPPASENATPSRADEALTGAIKRAVAGRRSLHRSPGLRRRRICLVCGEGFALARAWRIRIAHAQLSASLPTE